MIKQKLKEFSLRKHNIKNNQNLDSMQKEPLGLVFKKFPFIIDFENKKKFFKQEIKNIKSSSNANNTIHV